MAIFGYEHTRISGRIAAYHWAITPGEEPILLLIGNTFVIAIDSDVLIEQNIGQLRSAIIAQIRADRDRYNREPPVSRVRELAERLDDLNARLGVINGSASSQPNHR